MSTCEELELPPLPPLVSLYAISRCTRRAPKTILRDCRIGKIVPAAIKIENYFNYSSKPLILLCRDARRFFELKSKKPIEMIDELQQSFAARFNRWRCYPMFSNAEARRYQSTVCPGRQIDLARRQRSLRRISNGSGF